MPTIPIQTHKGKIVRQDGQIIFKSKLNPQSAEMDIPVEELFEDFENKDVEIDLVPDVRILQFTQAL